MGMRELERGRELTKAFGHTTRGGLRQRDPKGFWERIKTDSLTHGQVDALVDLRLKDTFSSKSAGEFIQLLPEELRSKFKRRLIGARSFWQAALKFLIQNDVLAELQDGKLILKLWLPDGIMVLLAKALERLVEAKAKQRVVDLQQAEFMRALGEHYSAIAEAAIQRGSG